MKKIAEIVKDIKSEIKDAEGYYLRAIDSEDGKETYKYLSTQELDHANRLHELAVKSIQDYKLKGGTVPEGMQIVWDYEHSEMINDIEELKSKISKI